MQQNKFQRNQGYPCKKWNNKLLKETARDLFSPSLKKAFLSITQIPECTKDRKSVTFPYIKSKCILYLEKPFTCGMWPKGGTKKGNRHQTGLSHLLEAHCWGHERYSSSSSPRSLDTDALPKKLQVSRRVLVQSILLSSGPISYGSICPWWESRALNLPLRKHCQDCLHTGCLGGTFGWLLNSWFQLKSLFWIFI